MRKLLLLCLLGLVSHATAEGRYVIQVGAFKQAGQAPEAVLSQMAQFGEPVTATTQSGVMRLGVGYFGTVAGAEETLQRLRAAGYSEAFVRGTRGFSAHDAALVSRAAPAAHHERAAAQSLSHSRFDANSILDTLTAEERAKMVLLDGQPHIKEGERFIPLADYRR